MAEKHLSDLSSRFIAELATTPDELHDRAVSFEASAAAGDVLAMTAIGFAYYFGVGVAVDKENALKWLERAVALGEPIADWVLGWLLVDFENDTPRGVHLIESAVDRGFQPAIPSLAELLATGRGTTQDLPRAAKLFDQACRQGDIPSCIEAGSLYRSLGDRMSARRCFLRAAELGDLDAQETYGEMLAMVGNTLDEIELGTKWLTAASKAGKPRATYVLAVVVARGIIGSSDLSRAADLCRRAADAGEPSAQYMLALMYERGEGVTQDVVIARSLLKQAAANGSVSAQKRLRHHADPSPKSDRD